MNVTQDGAKTQENTSTQAITYLTHQDQLHIPPNMDSHAWFAFLGASHHITFNPTNLHVIKSYDGHNKVVVGNGYSLGVKTIGHLQMHSNSVSNSMLRLSNVLHVPNITRNLIYISKLAKDNQSTLNSMLTTSLSNLGDLNKCFLKYF